MKPNVEKQVQELLSKHNLCYVLLTCDGQKVDGHMDIKMTYEGDPNLAAYMIHGAQSYLEDTEDLENSSLSC